MQKATFKPYADNNMSIVNYISKLISCTYDGWKAETNLCLHVKVMLNSGFQNISGFTCLKLCFKFEELMLVLNL